MFGANHGTISGGMAGDEISYGIDKNNKMYIYNNTSNRMVHYGDVQDGFNKINNDLRPGRGNIAKIRWEGNKFLEGQDARDGNNQSAQPTQSPTSSGATSYYDSAAAARSAEEARQRQFYQALLDSLPGQKNLDRGLIDKKYGDSISKLRNSRDSAMGNLDHEQSKLDKQRAKAYGQIQKDSQDMLQGLNTQLGMMGAANSSATQMGAIATADLANQQSASITDDYNDQMSEISTNRAKVKKEYDDENNQLNTWKEDQYRNLDKSYQDLENNYRGKIGGQANLDAVVNTFRNLNAPTVAVDKLPEYKAEGLDKVDMSGQIQAPSLSTAQAQKYFTNNPTVNQPKKKDEDDPNKNYIL